MGGGADDIGITIAVHVQREIGEIFGSVAVVLDGAKSVLRPVRPLIPVLARDDIGTSIAVHVGDSASLVSARVDHVAQEWNLRRTAGAQVTSAAVSAAGPPKMRCRLAISLIGDRVLVPDSHKAGYVRRSYFPRFSRLSRLVSESKRVYRTVPSGHEDSSVRDGYAAKVRERSDRIST